MFGEKWKRAIPPTTYGEFFNSVTIMGHRLCIKKYWIPCGALKCTFFSDRELHICSSAPFDNSRFLSHYFQSLPSIWCIFGARPHAPPLRYRQLYYSKFEILVKYMCEWAKNKTQIRMISDRKILFRVTLSPCLNLAPYFTRGFKDRCIIRGGAVRKFVTPQLYYLSMIIIYHTKLNGLGN